MAEQPVGKTSKLPLSASEPVRLEAVRSPTVYVNSCIFNLRSGSIFVLLCNNIPAGKTKGKQPLKLGLISG